MAETTAAENLRVNRAELADFFSVAPQTIDNWVRAGCPVAERGSNGRAYEFDVYAVKAWRDQTETDREAMDEARRQRLNEAQSELFGDQLGDDDPDKPMSPAERQTLASARLKQIQVAKEQGRLVVAEEMQITLATVLQNFRNRVRSMPDRLARRLDLDDKVVEALRAEIDASLDEVADRIEAIVKGGDHAKAA